MKNRIILYGLLLLLASCVKMNDNIKEYMDRGEINYIGKVDSASTAGGKERILFKWKANNDPRIEQCWIYWNNMRDSASFPVSSAALDENGYMTAIPNIPEGTYVFNMYHAGSKGYRSVPQEITGRSYGQAYQSFLKPRKIQTVVVGLESALVDLGPSDEGEIKTDIVYESVSGEMKTLTVLPDVNRVTLTDYKLGALYSTVTHYLPEPQALDEFTVASADMYFPDEILPVKLDKSLWRRQTLLGDNTSFFNDSWTFELIFDDIVGNQGWHTSSGTSYPVYFTIDLGVTSKLANYTLWQRIADPDGGGPYTAGNPKKWKVYGSASLSESTDPAYWTVNGGFADDWVLLADCYAFKPSGDDNPVSEEDMEYATRGHYFEFPADAPPVRYVRFYVEEVWNPSGYFHFSEITFWGML